jgi:phage terminase large subunit-like protein
VKAQQVMSAQNNFKTKHLNLWVNADVAWMDMRAWDRCGDVDLKVEDIPDGTACVEALDLATKTDIASRVKLFKRWLPEYLPGNCQEHKDRRSWRCPRCYPTHDEVTELERPKEPHYFLFVSNYLPEDAVVDGRNSQYQGWALEGWLIETPGNVLDFGLVKEDLLRDVHALNVREVAYDPWQCAQLAQELQDGHGLTMVELRPTVANFSMPMKELEALTLQLRFHHEASPAVRWMVSNVVCHRDAKDNIYPRKERSENKIDAVVAAIMALARAVLDDDPYAGASGFKTL